MNLQAPAIDVLIVDDHMLFAAGLRAVLERAPDILVVGIAGTADDAVHFAERRGRRGRLRLPQQDSQRGWARAP